MLGIVGPPGSAPIAAGWKKRLTYVTTISQNTTARNASVGTVIGAERLVGVKVRCPRCDAPAATVWRRFDYFGRELPLYFAKCRHCHRRRPLDADEVGFRLLEAGVTDPMGVLHEGIPVPAEGSDSPDGGGPSPGESGAASVRSAEALVLNRRRAYGKHHPMTFAARAGLADAVGRSGQAEEAARMLAELLVDQLQAVGDQSPAVLANRYRAAVWTARAGRPVEALAALRALSTDQERVLGSDHSDSMVTRATIAQLIDETGDRQAAVEMLRQVARDQLRLLGSEHPATEATQRLLAKWAG